MEIPEDSFHAYDYVVFALSLAVSFGIGVFFLLKDMKNLDTKEYLVGGNNMNPIAVGLSIAASLLNAVFLIGGPSEIYYFGIIYSLIGVAWVITIVITAHVFIPFFRHTSQVSCYEYLGVRFNSLAVRLLASATFAVSILLSMAVVLHAPALAFEAVTGFSIHISQLLCGGVSILYVVLGGLKAVVWTDVVQIMIIMGGTLTIAIMGAQDVGGASKVWDIAKEDNRINFDIMDHNPTARHTIWTQIIGQAFIWLPVFCINQMAIQRYYAVSSTLKAQLAMYVCMLVIILILAMVTLCGLVMYAQFRDCDPYIGENVVDRGDQLFVLMLMRLLGDFHGLPGLYMAAVFAAALSSVSSAINSLAAVVVEDFIKPLYSHLNNNERITECKATWVARALSFSFGIITIALSYVAPLLGDKLIQIPPTILGVVGAPLFGVFVLAIFFPCANAAGAICGLLVSLTFSSWLSIGGIRYGRNPAAIKPIGNCFPEVDPMLDIANVNMSDFTSDYSDMASLAEGDFTAFTTPSPRVISVLTTTETPSLQEFYSVSYAWYGLINTAICVMVGLAVSLMADKFYYGFNNKSTQLRSKNVFDVGCRCCCYGSPGYNRFFRCNVTHKTGEDIDYTDMNAEETDVMDKNDTNATENPAFHNEATVMISKGKIY